MNILLDTHAFLWHFTGSHKISQDRVNEIEDVNNVVYVSAACLWEITIKKALGKLEFEIDLLKAKKQLDEKRFVILQFSFDHFHALEKLPFHHRDPFDRMMIAQAISENLTVITRDPEFKK